MRSWSGRTRCTSTSLSARDGWAYRRPAGPSTSDPDARNGWETHLRIVWMLDGGLPRPRCHRPVFDLDGNLLGFPDLLDPEAGTVGEFDGGDHREPAQHGADNAREELFEDHGLVVTRATSLDFADRAGLAARMRRAHARGLRRDHKVDRWTLELPPEWGAAGAEDDLAELLDGVEATWTQVRTSPR